MNEKLIISKTVEYVKSLLEKDSSGHDWWHIYRVWNNTKLIEKGESDINMFIVELSALLHDLGDYKLNNGVELGSKPAREWLNALGVDLEIINAVCHIIDNMSFNKMEEAEELSIEGKIVQDADRLDALGAIGIARCFTFNGNKGNLMYHPEIVPNLNKSVEEYRKPDSTAINHFYEKLFLLKGKMNTKTARKIAEKRDKFMKDFVNRFLEEWSGNK